MELADSCTDGNLAKAFGFCRKPLGMYWQYCQLQLFHLLKLIYFLVDGYGTFPLLATDRVDFTTENRNRREELESTLNISVRNNSHSRH